MCFSKITVTKRPLKRFVFKESSFPCDQGQLPPHCRRKQKQAGVWPHRRPLVQDRVTDNCDVRCIDNAPASLQTVNSPSQGWGLGVTGGGGKRRVVGSFDFDGDKKPARCRGRGPHSGAVSPAGVGVASVSADRSQGLRARARLQF